MRKTKHLKRITRIKKTKLKGGSRKVKGKLINFGFDFSKVKIESDNYLGDSLEAIKISDGHFKNSLPIYEPQAEEYETWGCTIWGGQNQIEIYTKAVFGFEPNYNEIFNYILAKVREGGANPHTSYETFRKSGLIDNQLIPFPDTYEKFQATQITPELTAKGQEWLNKWDFKHAWITNPTIDQIVSLLPYGPIGISVTAWFEKDGLYIDNGMPNTHWCVAFDWEDSPIGKILYIFDSYDHSVKKLHPTHKISVAKRITLKKKDNPIKTEYQKAGFYQKTWLIIKKFLWL